MEKQLPRFRLGQIVWHHKYEYRGVIVQVDSFFRGTEEWYKTIARSAPPKDAPWYHVLVEKAEHITYVTEQHLLLADDKSPVDHPLISYYFDRYETGFYVRYKEKQADVEGIKL